MGPEAALCPYGPRKPARRKRSTQPGAFFPARFWKRNKRNVDEGGKCKAVGSVEIDGRKYTRDVTLDQGQAAQTEEKPSRGLREEFGHTPVSLKEEVPWECKRLVVGTGMLGHLPAMDEVKAEAHRRGAELVRVPRPRRFRCSGTTPPTRTPSCTSPAESARLATQQLLPLTPRGRS